MPVTIFFKPVLPAQISYFLSPVFNSTVSTVTVFVVLRDFDLNSIRTEHDKCVLILFFIHSSADGSDDEVELECASSEDERTWKKQPALGEFLRFLDPF